MYIPFNETDYGSIIAFALASNAYKGGMIIQNYMEAGQKVKGYNKHFKANHGSVPHTETAPTPMNAN
jgi:hypothetical protein